MEKCILTGYKVTKVIEDNSNPLIIKYESNYSGIVNIAQPTYLSISNNFEPNWILAGINLHNTLDQKKQILIDNNFINHGFKSYSVPKEFEEKCYLTLKGLYQMFGKENRIVKQGITRYSSLGFTNSEEFKRILERLISERLIDCRTRRRSSHNNIVYLGVSVTNAGRQKAKEMLPKIPMVGLVDKSISTGSSEIDVKVNHAKDLFFKEPQKMENMRSACEQLSFILEPMREDLKRYFNSKDISAFFEIVNNFDIRHNKDSTINMKYPEQLEWVFYTLLNSINTYYKIEKRFNTSK